MSSTKFVDHAAPIQGAVVIHPDRDSHASRGAEARLDEAVGLALALDLEVRERLIAPIRRLTPATLFGSGKVEEIREDRQVNVSCLRSRDKAYISISAIARIDNNPSEVGRLWKPDWKIWMSEEPSDGSISILKLTVEEAEYWQPEGGRLRVLYSIVQSLLNDEPAEKSLNPPKRIV